MWIHTYISFSGCTLATVVHQPCTSSYLYEYRIKSACMQEHVSMCVYTHTCARMLEILIARLISLWSYDSVLTLDKELRSRGFVPSAPLPGNDMSLAAPSSSSVVPPTPKVRAQPWGPDVPFEQGGTATAATHCVQQSLSPRQVPFRQCGKDCRGRGAAGPYFGIATPASEIQRCGDPSYGLQQREVGEQRHSKGCRITAKLRTLAMYTSGWLFFWLLGEGWAQTPACTAPALVWVWGAGAAARCRSGAGAVGSSSRSPGGWGAAGQAEHHHVSEFLQGSSAPGFQAQCRNHPELWSHL